MEELNAPKEKSALETGPRDEGIKSNGCKKEKGYFSGFEKDLENPSQYCGEAALVLPKYKSVQVLKAQYTEF